MKNIPKQKYSVAELFCGCGGFSHGFWQTGRFETVLGNDIKKYALKTFKLNHSRGTNGPSVLEKDIRTISDFEIIRSLQAENIGNLDVLLGGPPCQGFSQMRRTKERKSSHIVRFGGYNKLDQDPRNDLVLRFLEVAMALNPKVIVIENVPQFLSHYHNGKRGGVAQQVEDILADMGYEVDCNILNAADYGVPQLRQRAFILASRVGKIMLPPPSHGAPELVAGTRSLPWVTVDDALIDLPDDAPFHDILGGKPNIYLCSAPSLFIKKMRTSLDFPFNHVTRKYQKQIVATIKHMRPGETWNDASERMQKRFETILKKSAMQNENEVEARRRLESEGKILPQFYKKYYWSAYTRLAGSRPALTITANANFLGSGRFTHPIANRGITMREAARLQSFDDAFTFYTSDDQRKETENIGVGLDMIGEAVPPILARAIGDSITTHLDQKG